MGQVSQYTAVAEVQDADKFYLARSDGAGGFLDRTLDGDAAKRIFGAAEPNAVDPTVDDDETLGYRAGSFWANTVSGALFLCTDPSTGAAVWTAVVAGAGLSVNAQTGTSYTYVLGDGTLDTLVTHDNASPITVTVPTNASVAFPVGTVLAGAQIGVGLVSIVGATGVTVNGATPGADASAGQWSTWTLTKLATNTWLLSGGIA